MILYLLKHQWAQFRRSASFERELGLTILIAVIVLFFTANLIFLAIKLPELINNIDGIGDPVKFINVAIIYYLLAELVIRFLLQQVPVLDIQPYLSLPIKRKNIARFLLGKSIFSIFNVYALVLTLPFALKGLVPTFGFGSAMAWFVSVVALSLSLHFFNILFKKKLEEIPVVWVIILALAAGNYALTHYYGINIFEPIANALYAIIGQPYLVIVPLFLMATLIYLSYKFFCENLYLEEITEKKANNVETYSESFGFLGRSTLSNTLILQEIKMIIRHKRTRSVLLLSLLFVGYGLIFFGEDNYSGTKSFYIFLGIFMSALFTINYGQFFWSWYTNQLDFFLTRPIAVQSLIEARYKLLIVASLVSTALCVPYVYFGWDVLLLLICCCLFNMGINIPIMIRISMWSPKPIDLNKGAIMNYQGTGAAQWLMGLPILLSPYAVFIPVNYFFGYIPALLAIALVGAIGIVLRNYFIGLIARKFAQLKYKFIHDLTI